MSLVAVLVAITGHGPDARADRVTVAVTIVPVYDIVRQVGGPAVEVVLAPLFGTTAALAGLAVSYAFDLPSGPAIVIASGLGFLGAWLWRARAVAAGRRRSRGEER